MSDRLHRLVESLQKSGSFPHPVKRFAVVETHISLVLLTGDYAYKFKKPVNFGFLDFSSLERRHHFCAEELRLNRRLAPELYLEVVAIREGARLDGTGKVIEYAVFMREFEQDSQFDQLLENGRLPPGLLDELARRVADFHARAAVAEAGAGYGAPDRVQAPAEENFRQILACLAGERDREALMPLRDWSWSEFRRLRTMMEERRKEGFVRECHGDLHLRNIALVDGRPLAFDCIEFNDSLRWIDIISEVAFMVMDLDHRAQTGLASRFLNVWLEYSGDYEGLALLRYYRVYRAMVRAKVDCLRAYQPDVTDDERAVILDDYRRYVELARRYTQSSRPLLILMHGVSGSGKTTVSQSLLESLPAIRVRSDIERKRLHGFSPRARTGAGVGSGIYDSAASDRTYARLAQLAAGVLDAGYSVIVDATFLEQERMAPFVDIARSRGLPCVVLDCRAGPEELRRRLRARRQAAGEASEAGLEVLERQLRAYRPLERLPEGARRIVVDSAVGDIAALAARLGELARENT